MVMNIIYTNHALERIRQRHLDQREIELTVREPSKKFPAKDDETKFLRTIDGRRYQVIAKYVADQGAWLVVSAWVRGEEDPEPMLWTILAAPFRLLWEIVSWAWGRRKRGGQKR